MKYLVLLLGALLLSTAQLSADSKPVVKIGIILPLSGGMAHVGTAFRDAARQAIEEMPPSDKFKYEIIFEDDQLQSAKAASAAQKLIEVDKVDAIVSTWSYGGTVVSPIAERAHLLHFGVAWDPAVAKGELNFIHMTPPRGFVKSFLAGFKKKGYKRICAMGWNESGSLFFLDELDRLAPAAGFQIVKRVEFQGGERDFRSVIMLAERLHPDVYLVNLSAPEIDILVRQLAELHISTPITAITGFEVATNPAALEGKWYVDDTTISEEFTRRFKERFGHTNTYGIGNFYDVVKLIAFLIEHTPGSGKPTPAELLAATRKIGDFHSIFGPLQLDQDGIINYQPAFRKIVGGKRVTVSLDDI